MTVTAASARSAARNWVEGSARSMPGFRGAFLAGSTATLPDTAIVPPWTDTDIMVVLDGEAPAKAGKFVSGGALLEGTYLAVAELADAETVLGSYHAAHAVATGAILDDPTGWLTELQATARAEFPRRRRVEARAAIARSRVEAGFARFDDGGSLAERAQAWVFPTGVMTHVLLVAGLRNPTVRRRYETVRDLLAAHGRLDLHERLLDLVGCGGLERATVERHLAAVAGMFDAAAPVEAPSYRFASDVTAISRPISIDGTQDLIARGFHREAVFWLVVTGSRALQKLQLGRGADSAAPFEDGYAALLADLGLVTASDYLERRDRAVALLPEVWDVAMDIIHAEPEVMP